MYQPTFVNTIVLYHDAILQTILSLRPQAMVRIDLYWAERGNSSFHDFLGLTALQEWAATPLWHGNGSQSQDMFFLFSFSRNRPHMIEGQSFTSVGLRPPYSSCFTPSLLKLFLWLSWGATVGVDGSSL